MLYKGWMKEQVILRKIFCVYVEICQWKTCIWSSLSPSCGYGIQPFLTRFVVVIAKWKDLMLDAAIDCLEYNYQSYKNLNWVLLVKLKFYLVSGHTILIPLFPALPYS